MNNENKAVVFENTPMTITKALEILEVKKATSPEVCYCNNCPVCAYNFLRNSILSTVQIEDKEKFKKALNANGGDYYANALQEECAELIQAISHIRRRRKGAKDKVLEEMVHVVIILEIYKLYILPFGQEEKYFRELFEKELNRIIWDAENGVVHSEK